MNMYRFTLENEIFIPKEIDLEKATSLFKDSLKYDITRIYSLSSVYEKELIDDVICVKKIND